MVLHGIRVQCLERVHLPFILLRAYKSRHESVEHNPIVA